MATHSRALILDTNVISELMRRQPHATVAEWASNVPPDTVCTTSISLAEIRYRIARLPTGHRRSLLQVAADEVFEAFADRVLGFDVSAALHYGDIVVQRERRGTPIAGFDAQIAAICQSRGATLATRNTGDFDGLGLDLVNPWVVGG